MRSVEESSIVSLYLKLDWLHISDGSLRLIHTTERTPHGSSVLDCTFYPVAFSGAIQEQQVSPGRKIWARDGYTAAHSSFLTYKFQINVRDIYG